VIFTGSGCVLTLVSNGNMASSSSISVCQQKVSLNK
jgi:hypothetical protein